MSEELARHERVVNAELALERANELRLGAAAIYNRLRKIDGLDAAHPAVVAARESMTATAKAEQNIRALVKTLRQLAGLSVR